MLPMSKTQRIQLWLDRLRRQAASQLTVADFCRLDQISVASFYKWKLRLSPSVDSAPRVDSVPKRRKGKLAASHRSPNWLSNRQTRLTQTLLTQRGLAVSVVPD